MEDDACVQNILRCSDNNSWAPALSASTCTLPGTSHTTKSKAHTVHEAGAYSGTHQRLSSVLKGAMMTVYGQVC
jgi:hypothetical protein